MGLGRFRRWPRNRFIDRCCNTSLLRWLLWIWLSILWRLSVLLRLRPFRIRLWLSLWLRISSRILRSRVLPALSVCRLLPLSSLLSICVLIDRVDDWSSRQTIEKDRRKAVFLFFGIVGGGSEER